MIIAYDLPRRRSADAFTSNSDAIQIAEMAYQDIGSLKTVALGPLERPRLPDPRHRWFEVAGTISRSFVRTHPIRQDSCSRSAHDCAARNERTAAVSQPHPIDARRHPRAAIERNDMVARAE